MKPHDVTHWRAYLIGMIVGVMIDVIIFGAGLTALRVMALSVLGVIEL